MQSTAASFGFSIDTKSYTYVHPVSMNREDSVPIMLGEENYFEMNIKPGKIMNRPIASNQVKQWLERLKLSDDKVEFPDFVAQYSSLFADEDPDIPKKTEQSDSTKIDKGNKIKNDRVDEKWLDGADEHDKNNEDGKNNDETDENNYDYNRKRSVEREFEDKNITDLKTLAELKSIFDRFAVDNAMTAPETCQALTESGIIVPRKEIAQYLRSRKHLGVTPVSIHI